MPRDTRKRCAYGHDWRVSFDGRFYYCYHCPAQWQGNPGETPPQETYRVHPTVRDWTTRLPQGATNTMPSKEFDDFLDADDEAQTGTQESWMRVRDMLYEPIRVTRANLRTEDDSYNPGQTREVAYVHFHFLDDLSETPFVFSSSARAIKATVKRAVDGNEFPFDVAVIEILSTEPFNGYFPLRFTSLGKLPEAKAAWEASNGLVEQTTAPVAPVYTPPVPPTASAASARSKARDAATVGTGSVDSKSLPSGAPANLRNRGN